ncbi:MAG TPA: hypothetical protein VF881_02715 [Polyangiaceae bacterium]
MSATNSKEKTVSQVVPASRCVSEEAFDWDGLVREAFLDGCLQQGVRAELATRALAEASDSITERALRNVAEDASRRAALAWLTIDTCLEQYGELAALALGRCIEEAALQTLRVRRPSSASSLRIRKSEPALIHRGTVALSIILRGRERLAQFWENGGLGAA